MRRKIAAGNWKMNGMRQDLEQIATIKTAAAQHAGVEVVLCLPATLLAISPDTAGAVKFGAQDCHAAASGAYTGDLSAPMLRDVGAEFVILGHSERRAYHGETNAQINEKTQAVWSAGLTAIVCIGETETEYRAGKTLDVLKKQLAGSLPPGATAHNTIVAYEPVWAIGTGLTPSIDEIAATHAFIRSQLADSSVSILYGGSVSATNSSGIFAIDDVDGGLVGGASLKAATFTPIIAALSA